MRSLDILFERLAASKFRTRFKLTRTDGAYLASRSRATILEHARRFINQRLAESRPANDGRQTPMRGHPVFVAQHATATCCRKCLAKWHGIQQDRPLSDAEVDYIVKVIDASRSERQRWLF